MKSKTIIFKSKQVSLMSALCVAVVVLCFNAFADKSPLLTAAGFVIPQAGRVFTFPRDHGSHPEFSIEWWYITGHLENSKRGNFGFQATFFRRALLKPDSIDKTVSGSFGNDQLYLAHVALVDESTGTFYYQERLNRAGWDAAASTNTLDVRNGNWFLRFSDANASTIPSASSNVFQLQATIGAEISFELRLSAKKPLVIFGTNGVSRKAEEVAAASHYLTFPRLGVEGALCVDTTGPFPVAGEA